MTEPRKTPQKSARNGQKRPRKPPPQRLVQKMQGVVPPVRQQPDGPEPELAAEAASGSAAEAASEAAQEPAEELASEPAEQVPAGPPPLRLTAAAAVSALEGLGVAVWGVTMFFTGTRNGVLGGLLVLVLAGIPVGAAYGLRQARRWSRGPALIIHLLSLPVAWTMLHSAGGGFVAGGAALGVVALAGLVLLVSPATTDALGISRTTAS